MPARRAPQDLRASWELLVQPALRDQMERPVRRESPDPAARRDPSALLGLVARPDLPDQQDPQVSRVLLDLQVRPDQRATPVRMALMAGSVRSDLQDLQGRQVQQVQQDLPDLPAAPDLLEPRVQLDPPAVQVLLAPRVPQVPRVPLVRPVPRDPRDQPVRKGQLVRPDRKVRREQQVIQQGCAAPSSRCPRAPTFVTRSWRPAF